MLNPFDPFFNCHLVRNFWTEKLWATVEKLEARIKTNMIYWKHLRVSRYSILMSVIFKLASYCAFNYHLARVGKPFTNEKLVFYSTHEAVYPSHFFLWKEVGIFTPYSMTRDVFVKSISSFLPYYFTKWTALKKCYKINIMTLSKTVTVVCRSQMLSFTWDFRVRWNNDKEHRNISDGCEENKAGKWKRRGKLENDIHFQWNYSVVFLLIF